MRCLFALLLTFLLLFITVVSEINGECFLFVQVVGSIYSFGLFLVVG